MYIHRYIDSYDMVSQGIQLFLVITDIVKLNLHVCVLRSLFGTHAYEESMCAMELVRNRVQSADMSPILSPNLFSDITNGGPDGILESQRMHTRQCLDRERHLQRYFMDSIEYMKTHEIKYNPFNIGISHCFYI